MIHPDGHAILTDFRVVKTHIEQTSTSQFIGTPAYASPEQLDHHALTHQADQFSLGATLYFALTSKRPFDNMERSAPVPPGTIDPSIPAQLESTVLRMLQPSPNDRFQTLQDIIDALNHTQHAGLPLAGRQQLIEQSSEILDFVEQERPLIVHVLGIPGVGKRWFIDSLISAAQRRSVSYFELYNQRSVELIEQRLRHEPLLVIDWENRLLDSRWQSIVMFEYHRSDEQTYGGPSMHLPPRQNRSQRLLSVSFDSVVDCRSSCFPYSKCMSENNSWYCRRTCL